MGRVSSRQSAPWPAAQQGVRLHLEPPELNLTLAPSAKDALETYIAAGVAQVAGMQPVVALTWTVGARVGNIETDEWRTLDPHWGVAFYDAHDFPKGLRIMEIDGIPFAYGFESNHLLSGGTLHCNDGKFHVEKSAT